MSNDSIKPTMCWETANIVETFRIFKQQCTLYFSVANIPAGKHADHILLLSGKEGLGRYNSWTFKKEEDKKIQPLFGAIF